jgi:hypothetical protein
MKRFVISVQIDKHSISLKQRLFRWPPAQAVHMFIENTRAYLILQFVALSVEE